jgi:hypothetical protein
MIQTKRVIAKAAERRRARKQNLAKIVAAGTSMEMGTVEDFEAIRMIRRRRSNPSRPRSRSSIGTPLQQPVLVSTTSMATIDLATKSGLALDVQASGLVSLN